MGLLKGIVKGVIVTAVGGAGTTGLIAVATQLGLTPPGFLTWLKTLGQFWVAEVKLPRWECWLLWAAVVLLFAILLLIYFAWRWPNTPQYRYRGDVLYGLKWRWAVTASGEVHSQRMYCPKCDHQVFSTAFGFAKPGPAGTPEYSFVCESCGYSTTVPPLHLLNEKVKRNAERNIRTGDWKGRPRVT